ncbi:hypothetical protein LguiA_002810 [Lonicera macranthoides]
MAQELLNKWLLCFSEHITVSDPFMALTMEETRFFDKMMINLRSTCKYYTGYPKDPGPLRVIHFSSEREFVQLLHEGHPVVVAFTIRLISCSICS